jgi:diacylglycerol kinase family enzyme
MKHIFIANPAAGPVDSVPHIRAEVEKLRARYDCEIYETRAPGDAIRYIRAFCDAHPGDRVRFYACGGDGTLNEVLNGAIGYPEASISVYPCGSGNDFVKYYGAEHFLSIPALLEGEEHGIDVLTNGESYAININCSSVIININCLTTNCDNTFYKRLLEICFLSDNNNIALNIFCFIIRQKPIAMLKRIGH